MNDFQIRKFASCNTCQSGVSSLQFVRHFGKKGEVLLERTSQLFASFCQSKDFYAKGAIGYQAKYALFHSQVTFNAFCSGGRVPKLCFEIFFMHFSGTRSHCIAAFLTCKHIFYRMVIYISFSVFSCSP